ncbi:MAG: gamma-glutamyltransferase [Rhodobacteraceae bacterium]|jgi:gamma-glutamyltranspeptidase/glutathione hydrolase|uniref:Glutathione hydrolase proenzyme n=1 Tax=Salipiger profundus TaxID=1229727 RepID=A0A1U7D262_9RHOB|nr:MULTISPECIES: gamma-glutamyltransferase [Salipiger]APX22254.1 gamma-glutamyltranspeptidase / glutathione hydrolase [Salipiger profundus]MAB08595.1 gamma-glutamyltransferase [Paracoccaceae bacterium]GGA30098.1 gamma-glutamyltransferase [Salipiger profundus]SFD92431.1 gamma-glutamyltranspeptidase / glutathione hydrolase [Salipiger profundus]
MASRWIALVIAGMIAGQGQAQQAADAVTTEGTSTGAVEGLSAQAQAAMDAKEAGEPVTSETWMVSAANPLAVEAGAEVLRKGGSAADAMVAVQTVLGLVEPQSSGLGGGAFLVWFDAESGELTTLDGRETAPLAATPTYFQDEAGEPLSFFDAVVGGRSVGTPGTPALLEAAHDRWGNQDWPSLFETAIGLAEDGFTVSPRLAGLVASEPEGRLDRFEDTAAYFYPDGAPLEAGDRLTNKAYAEVLRAIAQRGSSAFYDGPIADAIVSLVQENGGLLAAEDFATYEVVERAPVCVPYRTTEVCGMGPPSSGALTVGQILGMLDSYALSDMGPDSAEAWTLIGDASRLAFADRGRYMADSDFVPMPTKGLVDDAYLDRRAEMLDPARALEAVEPGEPAWDHAMLRGDDVALELPSTSHISIVDAEGNALSMTTTIENGFGSRLFVRGFLLNNELTDFSFATHNDGRPIANRVEPGKRPRSSMSPTIVMQDGAPLLVIGSPGGSRIIGYVAQGIVNYLDFGMNPQQAVAAPHLVNRFGTFDIETDTDATALEADLQAAGFETNLRELTSGLHVIALEDGKLVGGADPRREGIALGE